MIMKFWIFCTILSTTLMKYTEQCSISQDNFQECILTCKDNINIDFVRQITDPYSYNGHRNCRNNQNRLNISELIYKGFDGVSAIPLIQGYNTQKFLDAIYSLNLIANGYHNVPTIKSMRNLKLMNLSRNNLTTAVLSNINELDMMTVVDFSYNIITDIQVNSYQYVYHKLKKINFSHNKLVKIPDAIFDEFRDLKVLDLSYNQIRRLSVVTFEGVRKLTKLDLSNNHVTSINGSLFRFSQLDILNFGNNQIEDIQMNDFEQLCKLRRLDLSSNKIKLINVNVFRTTIVLETLDLSDNLLAAIEPNTFLSLQSLSSINLSHNKLVSLPIDLFKNTNIFNLSITENRLEGAMIEGMFQGVNVPKLDLSHQSLSEVKDYAFRDLNKLNILLLNSNNISLIANKCFKTLDNLEELDLTNNRITILDFDTNDLSNLKSFMLKNNRITEIKYEVLHPLINLQFLDISENQIAHFNSNLFQSLKNLINLEIYNNPLGGALETKTFEGLVLVPSLDVSHSMFESIQNASFAKMQNMKEVNISHCEIRELQFNAFIHTGNIETLDLSYNKLTDFFVNTTELSKLSTLFLNNNLIKTITSSSLNSISRLNKITLSHNLIKNIPSQELYGLKYLQYLDLSNNEKMNFTVSMVRECDNLNTLILSGIRTVMGFDSSTNGSKINDLIISNASITNIRRLNLGKIVSLASLNLSFNNVSKLQQGDFSSLFTIKHLDLSYNKISFIQTGVFKDNGHLDSLNISHNCLTTINYGTLRGLNSLTTLDMSYNQIKDLQSERFYEVIHLTQLIVDFNQIDTIDYENFQGTSLTKLSIGNNPIPCQLLVKLNIMGTPWEITALKIDEHYNENVNGIVCNKGHTSEEIFVPTNNNDYNSLLTGLRNIFEDFNNKNIERDASDNEYLQKIASSLERLSEVLIINNKTNTLLSKISKILGQTTTASVVTTPVTPVTTVTRLTPDVPAIKNNLTQTIDVISYINHVKKELENTIAFEKQKLIDKIDSKLVTNSEHQQFLPTDIDHAKITSSDKGVSSFPYTGTYIALTLSITLVLVLVSFVLYRMYKSRSRYNLTLSNHILPGDMENSSL